MKQLLFILIVFLFIKCDYVNENYVTQHVEDGCYNLCNTQGLCFVTRVRYKGKIIKSWYDNPETISDSTVCYRKQQADDFLERVKKLNKVEINCK